MMIVSLYVKRLCFLEIGLPVLERKGSVKNMGEILNNLYNEFIYLFQEERLDSYLKSNETVQH